MSVGTPHGEEGELAALQRRAYGPAADIANDPVALARLAELEDRSRAQQHEHEHELRLEREPSDTLDREPYDKHEHEPPTESSNAPRRQWLAPALIAAAVAAIVVAWAMTPPPVELDSPNADTGGVAESADTGGVAQAQGSELPGRPTIIPEVSDRIWTSSAEGYEQNLAMLRERALSGSNAEFEQELVRLDVDTLRPMGTVLGRSVWVGEDIDGLTCLVLGGDDGPIIGCATPAAVDAGGLVVIASAADADNPAIVSDSPAHVRYTLQPDGALLAEPIEQ